MSDMSRYGFKKWWGAALFCSLLAGCSQEDVVLEPDASCEFSYEGLYAMLADRKKNPKEKHRFSGKVLEKQLQKKREDREKYGSLSAAAYGDFRDGLLTACEYRILTEEIADGIQSCEKAEKEILREQYRWEKGQGLTRGLILWLFEKVEVMENREIHISFCFRSPFKS